MTKICTGCNNPPVEEGAPTCSQDPEGFLSIHDKCMGGYPPSWTIYEHWDECLDKLSESKFRKRYNINIVGSLSYPEIISCNQAVDWLRRLRQNPVEQAVLKAKTFRLLADKYGISMQSEKHLEKLTLRELALTFIKDEIENAVTEYDEITYRVYKPLINWSLNPK